MVKDKVKGEIIKNGLTCQEIAKMIGMSPSTFSRRLKKGVFGTDEVTKIMEILNIEDPMSIFFDLK